MLYLLLLVNSIENHKIIDYLGIVTGVSLTVYGIFSSNNLPKAVDKAKEIAFKKLINNANNLKANAIVGIKIDVEILDQFYKVCVSVTGTAVKVMV